MKVAGARDMVFFGVCVPRNMTRNDAVYGIYLFDMLLVNVSCVISFPLGLSISQSRLDFYPGQESCASEGPGTPSDENADIRELHEFAIPSSSSLR